ERAALVLPADASGWFQNTAAVYLHAGPRSESWKTWGAARHEAVAAKQISGKGCLDGSWDPVGLRGWDRAGGRVHVTALSVLALEVPYWYSGLGDLCGKRIALLRRPPAESEDPAPR